MATWIEDYDADGAHWIVSFSGDPNPRLEDQVELKSKVDAVRLTQRLRLADDLHAALRELVDHAETAGSLERGRRAVEAWEAARG